MLFLLLLLLSACAHCQYRGTCARVIHDSHRQDLYLKVTGKLRGFQELGHAWSLIVGREGFEPLSIYVGDVNRLIADECAKTDDPSVPLNVAQILCDSHEIVNAMIAQFQPSIECKPDLVDVFRDKLWDDWMGAIDRFNSAICHLKKEEGVRIDLATMKPVIFIENPKEKGINLTKFKRLHGKQPIQYND